MPGRPLVADFDGTLTRLPVDWDFLRRRLGVERVSDTWWACSAEAWDAVTRAEVAAAAVSPLVEEAAALVGRAPRGFAVLTANSEHAVDRFLERFPELRATCRIVVGRETLGGPKTDPERFERGLNLCAACLGSTPDRVDYLGDADYELALATALGAAAIPVPASVAGEMLHSGTPER